MRAQICEVGGVVVLMIVKAVATVDLDAFVMRIQYEVDDAGDGVCTVDCRSAARQNIDAVDEIRWNLVDIRRRGSISQTGAGLHAAAVNQHLSSL